MKDEGNHQGAVEKSFQNNGFVYIVDANYTILCEKNWTCTRSGTGSYSRQADKIQVKLKLFKTTVHQKIRLFTLFNQGTASLQK